MTRAPSPPSPPAAGYARPRTIRGLRPILALKDLEPAARRLLPRSIFGFVTGGTEDERALAASGAAFADYAFTTRVLADVSGRRQSVELLGGSFASPFGIAPMGGIGFGAFEGDLALARAARSDGIPFVLSASSLVPMERIAAADPEAWFQTYLLEDRPELDRILDRAAAAGFRVLVVTVDIPVPGNRENNIRNGYNMPLRFTPRLVFDFAAHPRWLIGTAVRSWLAAGLPHFENQGSRRLPVVSRGPSIIEPRDRIDWDDFAYARRRWAGRLVVKGILSADDAARAEAAGADAVIVSSHGGRQLDASVAPLRVLSAVVDRVRGIPVLYDGGIRRGSDVLKALALGAAFTFVGRPYFLAAALAGEAGGRHVTRILRDEVDRNLALLGATGLADLPARLVRADGAPVR